MNAFMSLQLLTDVKEVFPKLATLDLKLFVSSYHQKASVSQKIHLMETKIPFKCWSTHYKYFSATQNFEEEWSTDIAFCKCWNKGNTASREDSNKQGEKKVSESWMAHTY